MAAPVGLARCKRKSLLDALLVGSSSAGCKIGQFISNTLRPGVFLMRTFASKVPFPWSQSSTDIYLTDPLLHRVCGSLLLYRALKKVPDGQLDPSQFLNEAKNCILMVCSLLRTLDPENKLSEVLGSRLGKHFNEALTRIKDPNSNFNLHLDLAKLGDLRISGVCCALGPLVPSEHDFLLDFLGQQVFIVPEDMEHLRGRNALSADNIKKVSQGSLDRGFRFQIGVKFWSQEKFYITGPMGKVVQGSKDFVYSHHLWQFESPFDWEKYHNGQYPLCWTVADMDKLVAWNLPTQRRFSSFFD